MKRSREEITEYILETCKEPTCKTRIVYQVNLNFKTVVNHLDRLMDAGLLEASMSTVVMYRTTAKGMEALEHIKPLRGLLRPAGSSEKPPLSTANQENEVPIPRANPAIEEISPRIPK